MPDELRDPELGISIRFIRSYDVERAKHFTHEDAVRFMRLQAYMADRAELLALEHQFALPSPPEGSRDV